MKTLVLVVSLLSACGGFAPIPPGPPLPSDADAAAQCDAICDRMALLGCNGHDGNAGPDGVRATDDDQTCVMACVDVQAVLPMDADCIVAAGTCTDLNRCETL